MKAMIIYHNKKKINIERLKKLNIFQRFTGLMFRSSNTERLLFEFSFNSRIAIHSFFVFFPFLAIWLDGKNRVVEFKMVRPFLPSIKPAKKFKKLIELPLNNDNKKIIGFFVGKRNI